MARNWGAANLAPGAPLGPGYSTENFALEARNDTVVALLAKVCMPHTHTPSVCSVCGGGGGGGVFDRVWCLLAARTKKPWSPLSHLPTPHPPFRAPQSRRSRRRGRAWRSCMSLSKTCGNSARASCLLNLARVPPRPSLQRFRRRGRFSCTCFKTRRCGRARTGRPGV